MSKKEIRNCLLTPVSVIHVEPHDYHSARKGISMDHEHIRMETYI